MDSKEHLAISSDTLSTTAPEVKSNQHIICMPTIKIDIKEETTVEFRDQEEPPCRHYMYPYKPLEPPKYVNYYDNKDYTFELKNEFPEDESPQLNCSMNSKIVSENTELLTLINKQKVKVESTEEELSLYLKEESEDKQYQFSINTERLEERGLLDNAPRITSIHYDILMTPQEVQCKFCGRIFKNRFNLLKHNNEHIKIKIITIEGEILNELQQRQYCENACNNLDSMLAHVSDVHSKKLHEVGLCEKQFKSIPKRKEHHLLLHKLKKSLNQVTDNGEKLEYCNRHTKLCRNGKQDEINKYKCDSCERFYINKNSLTLHVKSAHYDYGIMFECWCKKQFPSPIRLRQHKRTEHGANSKNEAYKCKCCEAVYNAKSSLADHMKIMHYDYGRTFECGCGKQFLTPIHLRQHKSRQHNSKFKGQFQCDSCQKIVTTKKYLVTHIKNMHGDNAKFACWCGKRFRTLIHLTDHKTLRHSSNGRNELYKCKYCEVVFKAKKNLSMHIKRVHYDYGITFKCWCGKQFRTPMHLRQHMRRQHGEQMKDTNNDKVQCDYCHKSFITKHTLLRHIERTHYDYGKVFECWCGKQFRSPLHLSDHKNKQHGGKIKDTQNYKFLCDYCHKNFKTRHILVRHIKSIHYDYGKVFECLCGKQFRTPIHLSDHKSRQHSTNIKATSNDKHYMYHDHPLAATQA